MFPNHPDFVIHGNRFCFENNQLWTNTTVMQCLQKMYLFIPISKSISVSIEWEREKPYVLTHSISSMHVSF